MDAPSTCRHCGLLLESLALQGFCCAGCRTAHEVINACGLGTFYRLRRDEAGQPAVAQPAAESGWLDGEAFATRHVQHLPDGRSVMRWRVDGIHCSACIWLLEHLPRLDPAISAARVDLGADTLTVIFAAERCRPSRQVALAASLGYTLHPCSGAPDSGRASRRREQLRLVVAFASATGAMHVVMNLLAGGLTGDLDAASRLAFAWLSLLVAAPALTYGAWPFWRGAFTALRLRRLTLDVTTALVLAVAILASLAHLGSGGDLYLDAAAMFVALLLAGRAAASAARRAALRRLSRFDGLLPHHALRLNEQGQECSVAVESLAPGDRVAVTNGAILPCDGLVESQEACVSVAVLTGEPNVVTVGKGGSLWAGSVNRGERLVMRATTCGDETRVGRLLDQARTAAAVDRHADHVWQPWFAVFLLIATAATWLVWRHLDPARALDQSVAMVMALCPCALGLGIPLVLAISTARAARHGVVVRDANALITLAGASDVVFDKTGTLTCGEPRIVEYACDGTNAEALRWLLAAELRSRHPVATALATRLRSEGITPIELADGSWSEIPGRGMSVETPWGILLVGTPAHAGVAAWAVPAGTSAVAVSLAGHAIVRAALGDAVKPGVGALLDLVRSSGAQVHLLSGDEARTVGSVGSAFGIPAIRIRGGALPDDKRRYIETLTSEGATVAMVGDGVNDAAALSAAQIGIGVRGGLASCLERCSIVALTGTADELATLIRGAREVRRTIIWCLAIALLYNLIAGGLVLAGWWGPLVCAIAMPASSLTVLTVAMLGRAFR